MLVNQETVCFVLPKSLFGTSGKAFRVVHNGFLKCRNDVFERIRVKHLQTGCKVLKTSLSFLILLLGCKWAATLLASESTARDTSLYGVLLLVALLRYRWYLSWLIRKRAGLMKSSSL